MVIGRWSLIFTRGHCHKPPTPITAFSIPKVVAFERALTD